MDRKIFGSDIWLQPVELRIFIYLIGQARFEDEPNRKYESRGVIIEKGQYLKSYRKLQKDLEYIENNSVKNYSLSRIKRALDNLKEQNRIKTEKTPLGTLFTVVNYCHYQGWYSKNDKHRTELEQQRNADGTELEQQRNNTNKGNKGNNVNKDNNNIVPKAEIEKIYNSLSDYWKPIFEDYIDIYRQKNKTKKITDNKHLRLLKELKTIFKRKSFKFDGQNYNLTDQVFEKGIDAIVEKQIDNLNYAKQVWISGMEKAKKREDQKRKKKEKVKSGNYQDRSGQNDDNNYKWKDFFIDFDKYKE